MGKWAGNKVAVKCQTPPYSQTIKSSRGVFTEPYTGTRIIQYDSSLETEVKKIILISDKKTMSSRLQALQ